MKKTIVLGLLLLTLVNADPNQIAHGSRSVNENISGENLEKFFYNKGLEDGLEEGKRIGYAKGREDSLKALKEYKRYITSLESGKYLSVSGKITPPRIYQEKKSDGSIAVIVKGCEIEGELSPSDILTLPVYDGASEAAVVAEPTRSSGRQNRRAVSDAVYLAGVDGEKVSVPKMSSSVTRKTFKNFPDTRFYRNLFRKTKYPFSVRSDKTIRVMFDNETEARQFVKRYDLHYARDYR